MKKKVIFKKHRRSKFTAVLLSFILVFTSLVTVVLPVSASPFEPILAGNITLNANSNAVVGVYANNIPMPGLAGYDFDINYDPSKIQILGITRSSSFLPPTPEFGVSDPNPSPDLGKLTVVSASSSGKEGDFKLFNVKIKALETLTNVCPLTITVKDFCDPNLVNLLPTLEVTEIPDEPDVSADDQNNQIIGLAAGMEYSLDDSAFTLYDSGNLPTLSGKHTVFVRWAATTASPPGAEKMLKFTDSNQVETPYVLVNGVKYYCIDGVSTPLNVPQGVPVFLASATGSDVSFYYTTDGSTPTTESTSYSSANGITNLPAGATTLKVLGTKNYLVNSEIATFLVTVSQTISTAPTVEQIVVQNNPTGMNDTVTVQNLHGGDIVKVYADAATQTVLGTATLPEVQSTGSVTVDIPQLGTTAGTVYVSVTSLGMMESSRTAVNYSAEVVSNPLNVVIGNASGAAGQNVTVNISLNNVAGNVGLGIVTANLTVNYDPVIFELISIDRGTGVSENATFSTNPTNSEITSNGANPGDIVFIENDQTQNDYLITTDGIFASIVFKIKDTTGEGTYPITFSAVPTDNSLTKLTGETNPVDDITGFGLVSGSVDVVNWLYGDLNGSSTINSTDLAYLQSYLLKKISQFPNGVPLQAADLNASGGINSTDLAYLQSYLLKKISKFPAQN
ncbi:MAG: hypothetical protein JL50_19480 [Peptococcaceae bacterium BICA1-7]|nr:MAG: hypothetical protein JL50_19480 [Peptococcaceae bacterium BICA1-7]